MRLQRFILRGAALIVPRHQRKEWLAEWNAELWYIREKSGSHATAFCLGGFADAFWLRRNSPIPTFGKLLRLESPAHCVAFLALLPVLTVCITLHSKSEPATRNTRGLVIISHARQLSLAYPTVAVKEYRSWLDSNQNLFTGIAFYKPYWEKVETPRHGATKLLIARATSNLVELLDLPASTSHGLILTHAAWLKYFDGDPHIMGRMIKIAGQQARVSSVIAEDVSKLPGLMDAWLIQDEQDIAALPSAAKGFAVGRVRSGAFRPPLDTPWRMSVANEDGGYDSFDCLSLSGQIRRPFISFLFVVFLAAFLVPATTTLSLGEYPADGHSPRWLFFSVKVGLILLMVYCGTRCELDRGILLPACIVAFRWALVDQRQRCPVCLRLLSNPVQVGQSAQNFLGWNGTELFCARGHGLLHVPAFPTSWFSTQRWLYLDRSWSCLFP